MPNITKPSDINNIWAATGDVVAPTADYVANGWEAIIPPREYFNWLDNKQDRFNAHVNQHGIPVWDSTTEYQAGVSYTKGSDGKVYLALTTNTNTNPVTSPVDTAWTDINGSNMVVFSTTGSFVWTVPAILRLGIKKPEVIVTGAGGSGGLGTGGARGAGGGAGATGIAIPNLQNIATVNIVVGASTANNSGGNSSFGTYVIAGGGAAATNGNGGSGGQGGLATGVGAINLRGGSGSDAQNIGGSLGGGSGDGGASYWGGGQRSGTQSGSVAEPPVFGGGAGGVPTSPRSIGGGGIVVIKW